MPSLCWAPFGSEKRHRKMVNLIWLIGDSSLQTNDSKWLDSSCNRLWLNWTKSWLDSESTCKHFRWLWVLSDSAKMAWAHHCGYPIRKLDSEHLCSAWCQTAYSAGLWLKVARWCQIWQILPKITVFHNIGQLFLEIFFDAKNLPLLKDGTAEKAICLRTYALG